MSLTIGQIPIKDDILTDNGTMSTTWISFFSDLQKLLGVKRNKQSINWTPILNTNIFSASGTITGTYTQKDNFIYFNVIITPTSGTTTSVLGSNWVINLPFKSNGTWFGRVFDSNNNDLGSIYIKDSTKQTYLPTWTAISGIITISGNYITNE